VKEGIAPRAGSGTRGHFSLPNLIALGPKASEASEKAAAAPSSDVEDENEELSMAIKLRHNAPPLVKEVESSDEEVEEEDANNGSTTTTVRTPCFGFDFLT
jgi:hypothetical protein